MSSHLLASGDCDPQFERGATCVEYAMLLALIATASLLSLQGVGVAAATSFVSVGSAFGSAGLGDIAPGGVPGGPPGGLPPHGGPGGRG